jgi:ferredoxin-like protein FixX
MSKRKRDTEETPDENNEERALKYQKASSTPLLELSEDEWSNISAYLSVGENIMVALSCKPLHEMITNVVKRKQPFLLTQWTIVKALLANRNALHINEQAEHSAMMEYMENNEFSKICPSGKSKTTGGADLATKVSSFMTCWTCSVSNATILSTCQRSNSKET